MVMRKILSASFWGLFGSTAAAKPDQSSLRTINTGSVIGAKGPNKTHVWRGIPYAKPPVGKLRWRAPRPPAPFGDVLLATKRSPVCTQYKSPLGNASWFQKAD